MFKQFGKALKNPRGSVFKKKKKWGKPFQNVKNLVFQFKMTHEDLNGENMYLTRYRLPGQGLLHMRSKDMQFVRSHFFKCAVSYSLWRNNHISLRWQAGSYPCVIGS